MRRARRRRTRRDGDRGAKASFHCFAHEVQQSRQPFHDLDLLSTSAGSVYGPADLCSNIKSCKVELLLLHRGKRMDLKGLRAFCSVAESGSFSRAAAALGVAQSVLSRQVSALEIELGARLFYRSGRGVTLTDLGDAVRQRAKSLLMDSEQLL